MSEVLNKFHADPYCHEYIMHESRDEAVILVIRKLKPRIDQFDGIALSGYSSATIGSIVAHEMKKQLCIVPKEADIRHSSFKIECATGARLVFVDDFLATGNTLRHVYNQIQNEKKARATLVATTLWDKYAQHTHRNGFFSINDEVRIPIW